MWCVLEIVKRDKRNQCHVMCRCGYIGLRRLDHIRSGRTIHCKRCSAKRTAAEHRMPSPLYTGCGDISGTFWFHIKTGAKNRGIKFAIEIDEAWELFTAQRGRCALSGVQITLSKRTNNGNPAYGLITASLDRKDSAGPYEASNCQWVHKVINYIKRDLGDADFIAWCGSVHKNRRRQEGLNTCHCW